MDRELTIRTEDGRSVSVPRGSGRISQRTAPGLEAVDNLILLPELDEPNMLHSLCVRYLQRRIYTRTGPVLKSMARSQAVVREGGDQQLPQQAIG